MDIIDIIYNVLPLKEFKISVTCVRLSLKKRIHNWKKVVQMGFTKKHELNKVKLIMGKLAAEL